MVWSVEGRMGGGEGGGTLSLEERIGQRFTDQPHWTAAVTYVCKSHSQGSGRGGSARAERNLMTEVNEELNSGG